tara:strand:- start:234 stop:692 length:459 start_codon:yes stop_codon:yes gene_type:complete
MKGIHLIKKFIPLILISVCLGDTLILNDKTVYNGILMKFVNDKIMFRAWPSAKLSINISDVQGLKLSDGTRVIENGIIVASNEKHIKKISYSRYLSLINGEKVKRRPERAKELESVSVGCCLIIILFGFLVFNDISFGSGFPDGPWPGDGHP